VKKVIIAKQLTRMCGLVIISVLVLGKTPEMLSGTRQVVNAKECLSVPCHGDVIKCLS
jgi:hypothetical protein